MKSALQRAFYDFPSDSLNDVIAREMRAVKRVQADNLRLLGALEEIDDRIEEYEYIGGRDPIAQARALLCELTANDWP
jgi:hypothetical protein